MAYEQLLFHSEARERAVKVALGPKSKWASVLLLTEATLTEVPA